MEFKKVRERAKEERGRTRPPTTAPTSAPTSVPTGVPTGVSTTAPAPAAPTVPPSSAAAADSARATGVPARLPRDPLTDFLAAYDDGAIDELEQDLEPSVEDERRFLSFELAGEAYAASIMDIREILKLVALTEVPRAPKEVLGVLSKRGVVMPVVDLASLLGLRAPDRTIQPEQRVLVVRDQERVVGLRVDRVRQVVRLGTRAIEEVPPSLGTKNAHMLLGLGRARLDVTEAQHILILLDIDAVLVQLAETVGLEARGDAGRRAPHA